MSGFMEGRHKRLSFAAPGSVKGKIDFFTAPPVPKGVKETIDSETNTLKVEGYLQKLGEKGLVKTWKTRWFVLDQNILSYYYERADSTPISFILLQTVKSVFPSSSMEINHKGFDFVLHTEGRSYMLSAGSDEDRQKWVQAITKAREEAAKPIPSSITKHNAAAAAASTPSSTSPPKNTTTNNNNNNGFAQKSFARSGGKGNSAARAAIRMSDSRAIAKELAKLDNPAAAFGLEEDDPQDRKLSIGAGRRGKSHSHAPPPTPSPLEDDDEIKAMRDKYHKEEQEELALEKKKLEEAQATKREEERKKQEEEETKKKEEADAKKKEEEEEAKKKAEEEAKMKEEEDAKMKEEEDAKKKEEEDAIRREDDKKRQTTAQAIPTPGQQNEKEHQDIDATTPRSGSPSSLSLSSSPASTPPESPSSSPPSTIIQPKPTRQSSFTRAMSMSALPPNGTEPPPEPAVLLKPPVQRNDISPLTSDDERDARNTTLRTRAPSNATNATTNATTNSTNATTNATNTLSGISEESANPFETDTQEPRKEPKTTPTKAPKPKDEKPVTESPNPFDSDDREPEPEETEQTEQPEQETSYVRKKIVFRKSVMPPNPGNTPSPQHNFNYTSMYNPISTSTDMGFGYNSFSGLPTDYGANAYPYQSNNTKVAARASLATSLESVKSRFTSNADGYLQVTSGTELRTIIGRAIASNGQSNLPGIQVGPFLFDFENGVWKLNIQKGSNEIGPRSESKEEYLATLREKKQKAIDDEDYNLASFLKHKEQSALTMESEIFVLPGGIVLCYRNSKWEITECPSQPGLVYLQPTPKKETPPPTIINTKLTTSILNPLQSLQSLLDTVVQVDPEDEEAVELLTQLEEAVSIIVVHFKETTAPTPIPSPTTPHNPPNFSQVLVSNLTTRSVSPNNLSASPNSQSGGPIPRSSSPNPPHPYTSNDTYINNTASRNMYNTNPNLAYDANAPFTTNNNNNNNSNRYLSPVNNNTRNNNYDKNKNAASSIAAAAAATNAKKLNSLVRGKFCTALVGVLANGLRKQLHILSIKEPHLWDFIEECGTWPKHAGLTGLALSQGVKGINAAVLDLNMRYRALVCEALNTKNLREWLQLMMSYEPLTEKYFEDFALIRHKNVFQKYLDCISRLTDLPFELDVMYEAKQQQRLGTQTQEPAQQPTQVLANIGSLFSSFLGPAKSEDEQNREDPRAPNAGNNNTSNKGLFGFKSVFNM